MSVIDTCPYSGEVDPARVRDVAHALLDMGCYEVSLGDTVGTGNPTTISKLLDTIRGGTGIPASKLAVGFELLALYHSNICPMHRVTTMTHTAWAYQIY